MSSPHAPVLLHEVVDALAPSGGGVFVDGTFGRGGHSAVLLERLGPAGRLLAFDRDPDAVAHARERFAGDPRFEIVHAAFSHLEREVEARGLLGKVDGLLLDLGVSSPQLDRAERGFSFMHDGPLDMRMDTTSGISVRDWLAGVEESELADVIYRYGEERHSRRIARAVVRARAEEPIQTTRQLAELIARASPSHDRHKHPATRTFQALRIFINRELDELSECLEQALRVLGKGARIAVISFHSLEDRLVKRFLREHSRGEVAPKGVPVTADSLKPPLLKLIGKAIRAGDEEVAANPRARSAVLRVAEKLA